MGGSLSSFLVSTLVGALAAAAVTVGATSAIRSSQANTGSDAPPSDVNSVSYADE